MNVASFVIANNELLRWTHSRFLHCKVEQLRTHITLPLFRCIFIKLFSIVSNRNVVIHLRSPSDINLLMKKFIQIFFQKITILIVTEENSVHYRCTWAKSHITSLSILFCICELISNWNKSREHTSLILL